MQPDVTVPQAQAFKAAYTAALMHLVRRTSDDQELGRLMALLAAAAVGAEPRHKMTDALPPSAAKCATGGINFCTYIPSLLQTACDIGNEGVLLFLV